MTVAGLDIGGTKIELQLFAADWSRIARHRAPTPRDYEGVIEAIAGLVDLADRAMGPVPVGISAAGLVDPRTGLALTANLPATGRPFPADIAARIGRPVTFINDCRAMALSEAHLGAARGASRVLGLVLGTGVGAGFVRDGVAESGATGIAGEVGHIALPAHLVQRHGLPVLRCGCGRMACHETLVSGPGLARIAFHLTGRNLTAPQIVAARGTDAELARVWSVWCELMAELLVAITVTLDPDVIVLGGGLSGVAGLCEDLTKAMGQAHIPGLALPRLAVAEGGDATGARGAALAALQAMKNQPRPTEETPSV
jgi:predicted NBD/HSP70 family sugar kinase